MKNRKFSERLDFALQGLRVAWRTEKSIRTQICIAGIAILVMSALHPPLFWWAIVGLTMAMVIAAELFNTALEHLVDHLHPEIHPRIKIVKDCAAAAVFVLSIGAVVIAVLLALSIT